MPVFLSARVEKGGAGLEIDSIGFEMGYSAVTIILTQLLFYKPIARKFGLLNVFRASGLLLAPLFLCFPSISYIALHYPSLLWAAMISFVSLYQFFTQIVMTAVITIVNNSVIEKDLGKINGIGQSVVSLTRGTSPGLMSSLFAWSISYNKFPIDNHFPFIILAFLTICSSFMSFVLPKSINSSKDKNKVGK
eukprot:TRINITY_DN25945_c0_g1_i1.p1 TRINITY_DN25945_c0_g1~~TRINITY_DN25945_c0_g1_i1.p1  ORF type:complete len:192 (+),score=33.31 TRINITY_DN25945_c0_g1_i1:728-1303(+)